MASLSACTQQDAVAPIGVTSPTFPSVNSVTRSEPATPQVHSTASPSPVESEPNLLTSGTVVPTQTARPTLNPTAAAEREEAIRNEVDAVYLIPEDPDQLEYILQPKHLISQTAQQEWGVSVTTTSSWDEAQQILDAGSAKALIVHHAAVDTLNNEAVTIYYNRCVTMVGIGTQFGNNQWEMSERPSPYQFWLTTHQGEATGSLLYEGWSLLHQIELNTRYRDPDDLCRKVEIEPSQIRPKSTDMQHVIDVPITADSSGCQRPAESQQERIAYVNDCIFWLDERDDELGFDVYLAYPTESVEYVFRLQPNQTELKLPAEALPNSDSSFEGCMGRKDFRIDIFVKTNKASTSGQVASVAVNGECDINQKPDPSPLDGLILSGPDGWDSFTIIRNGERTELTPSDYRKLKHAASKLNRAVLDDTWLFSIGTDGDIFVQSGEFQSRFWGDEALKTQYIWGIMGEWLIVSTVQADRFGQQAVTDLTAIALDGSAMQVIGRDTHISPAVSPDGSQVVFNEDNQVFTWSPNAGRELLSIEPYSSGRFSPDGRYIALSSEMLIIYDFETNRTILANEANIMGTHGLQTAIWNPTSNQVAIEIWGSDSRSTPAVRVIALDGKANDFPAAWAPMFSPGGKHLITYLIPSSPEINIIDLTTQEQFILPFPNGGLPVSWIDISGESAPALQPKKEYDPSPAEGLILLQPSGNPTYSIIQNGESARLDRYSAAVWLDGTPAQSFLAKQAIYNQSELFVIEDSQLFKVVGEQKTLIYDERPVSAVFGIIGDQVIVSSLAQGEERTQYIGSLTAISANQSDTQIIKREQSPGIPVIDKFRDRLIYVQDDYVETWYSDNRTEVLPFKPFRSGSVSPDGRFAALRNNNEINIYDLETNQILYSHKFEIANGDGFDPPVWNGSSEKVSFGVGHIESYYPYAVQIISIADGAVQSINGASNQAFSPDGDHIAVYQVSESDGSNIAIVDLQTEERQTLPGKHSGIPAGWISP